MNPSRHTQSVVPANSYLIQSGSSCRIAPRSEAFELAEKLGVTNELKTYGYLEPITSNLPSIYPVQSFTFRVDGSRARAASITSLFAHKLAGSRVTQIKAHCDHHRVDLPDSVANPSAHWIKNQREGVLEDIAEAEKELAKLREKLASIDANSHS